MDVSSTYDNVKVVSQRFVDVCREHELPGITFHRFEGKNGAYFFLESDRVVPFDPDRRGTRFEGRCAECGNFETVVGATPVYLRREAPLGRGFYRTDLSFGSNQGKRPILLIDSESAELLDSLRLRGLDLEAAVGTSRRTGGE
jgi:hypothetical protein